ncbi:MAG: plasmid pRiA4b ORF-3 family protein [Bacteroidota bacterium]
MKTIPLFQPPIKLKINLENMPHSVFRRVLIPENINMMQLHFIIQISIGWEFAHLFQFSDRRYDGNIIAGIPTEYDEEPMFSTFGRRPKRQNADEIMLKMDFLEGNNKKPFWYWYDFGDDWWHKLSFQKATKKDLQVFKGSPICVEAFGACPPEDIGGPWGYEAFLEAITNKKNPDYEEMREWAGLSGKENYDTEYVDLAMINESLTDLYQGDEWRITAENYFNG